MVIVTIIYVVATIAIWRANKASADLTKAQLAETKRQFDESNQQAKNELEESKRQFDESTKLAKEQLEESKRQFDLINKPTISIEVVHPRRVFWALRFTNNGTQAANDFQITLDDSFVESIKEPQIRELLHKNNGRRQTLGTGHYYDLVFGTADYPRKDNNAIIKGKISYKDLYGKTYEDIIEIDTNEYAIFFSFQTNDEDIKKKLVDQVKTLNQVNSNLNAIKEEIHQLVQIQKGDEGSV